MTSCDDSNTESDEIFLQYEKPESSKGLKFGLLNHQKQTLEGLGISFKKIHITLQSSNDMRRLDESTYQLNSIFGLYDMFFLWPKWLVENTALNGVLCFALAQNEARVLARVVFKGTSFMTDLCFLKRRNAMYL